MSLLNKYAIKAPRYTSYPAHPYWNNQLSEEDILDFLKVECKINAVDLYIHIPFCVSPCLYCGCNKIIAKEGEFDQKFLEAIEKEWSFYTKNIQDINIETIHFGGGTPTYLQPETLEKLLKKLLGSKKLKYASVEVDPRVTSKDHLNVLAKYGFNKISLGIQDFDPQVQKAINRIQPFDLVENIVDYARSVGFDSVNFDLIYGLPFQTTTTVRQTMEKVAFLNPDTISFFSYAHVPWKFKAQKKLEQYGLPNSDEKLRLYNYGKFALNFCGYKDLGLDHFSKEKDILFKAFKSKTLSRSFMGYTHKKSPILIGLGPSAISSSQAYFYQNTKDIKTYFELLQTNDHAIDYQHQMNHNDQVIGCIIQDILCYHQVNLTQYLTELPKDYCLNLMLKLDELKKDNLVTLSNGILSVTEKGIPYLRVIALVFDEYFKMTEHSFSSVV